MVDAKGHLLGRLASKIAKELLIGEFYKHLHPIILVQHLNMHKYVGTQVVVVRCEELNVTGSLFRNRLKYMAYLQKRTNTNPARGPFHHRAPSRMLYKV